MGVTLYLGTLISCRPLLPSCIFLLFALICGHKKLLKLISAIVVSMDTHSPGLSMSLQSSAKYTDIFFFIHFLVIFQFYTHVYLSHFYL